MDIGILLCAVKALDQDVLRSAAPNGENKNKVMCKPQEIHTSSWFDV